VYFPSTESPSRKAPESATMGGEKKEGTTPATSPPPTQEASVGEPTAAVGTREADAVEETDKDDDEEDETCGFCIFMKGGGCKETFNVGCFCVHSGC
jgi:mitochondrial intermembrane space import and assembly protein 40